MINRLYIILLTVALAITVQGCKKSATSKIIVSTPPRLAPVMVPHYTKGMDGTRTWHVVDSANLHIPYNGRDTVIYSVDTFGFTILNDTTLMRVYSVYSTDTFIHKSTDSTGGYHYFTCTTNQANWITYSVIAYHYTDNSMVYTSSSGGPGSTYIGQYERIKRTTP